MLKFFQILLSPFTVIYYAVIKLRNILFDNKIFKSEKVNAKVISVGNIVTGGSGKTPTTIAILKILKSAGINPSVLSRGYGRNTKGYLLISDGKKLYSKVTDAGDEIFLSSQECKVPAAVAENRVAGAKALLENVKSTEAIVLDDAFQHRWIYRDLDIIVLDQRFLQKVGKQEQHLLPLGVMREPFSAVNRANIIIVNRKFSEKKKLPEKILKFFKTKKVFYASYKATGIFDVKNHKYYSLDEFREQKSLVICGIARPYSFLSRLEQNNIDIAGKLFFKDHKEYTQKEIQQIRKMFYSTNAFSVITTQKDAVKLSKFSEELDDIDIYYLKIDMEIENEDEFNEMILNIFNNKKL